jgi:hypothetical protein
MLKEMLIENSTKNSINDFVKDLRKLIKTETTIKIKSISEDLSKIYLETPIALPYICTINDFVVKTYKLAFDVKLKSDSKGIFLEITKN